MIELKQQSNFLIGSSEAIRQLTEKDHARIILASDSHNHFKTLLGILRQFGPSCHCFAFCGDGLSDIANIYSIALEDEDIKNALPPVMAFVSGNCDPSSYPLTNGKTLMAPYRQKITVNGQNILITHGNREGVEYGFENFSYAMEEENCKTGVFGHTHIAEESRINDLKFINPGSCSNPRGGQPPSFAILTVEKDFIDTAFIKIDNRKGGEESFSIWQPGPCFI